MKRVVTAVAGNQVGSADYNNFQDYAASMTPMDSANDLSALVQGWDYRAWVSNAVLNSATQVKIDSSIDWRDRLIHVWYKDLGGANTRPGQSTDYLFDPGSGAGSAPILGYTGKGGYSNVNTLAAIANGTPPVIGSGSGANPSYALILAGAARALANAGAPTTTSASLFLYVDNANGSLYLYNNTGGGLGNQLFLMAAFSGKTGKRP